MADKNNIQQTTQGTNNSFTKGLNKDSDSSFVQDGMWTHAINAVNNTVEGNIGTLSNESSNYLCATTGSTMPILVFKKYIILLIIILIFAIILLVFFIYYFKKTKRTNMKIKK